MRQLIMDSLACYGVQFPDNDGSAPAAAS